MAFQSQSPRSRADMVGGCSDVAADGVGGSMLGVRCLNGSGMILHTRRWFEPGSELVLGLQTPVKDSNGRTSDQAFIHVRATVASRRVIKDSAIGRIYEVTLVFHPQSMEQQRRLVKIASEFTPGSIAVPSERDARTGEPNPLFGLN